MFLRNHDELTLEMVTDSERDYLWSTYAADKRARINLGIRRRLAPLMDNDRRKIELMNSLLMSMPGTPIIYYGDEIGMGDNIYLGDRNGVRTPMQWTSDRNGGFSRCDPAKLYLPCIMDPLYGYNAVNVEAQSRSLSSLLSWTKRLIAVRKSTQVFGRGSLTFIRPKNRAVLAYVRQLGSSAIFCVANLSRSAQFAELDLSAFKGRTPLEMLGRTRFPRIGELPYLVTLPPYGFFWFELCEDEGQARTVTLPKEVTTLVVGNDWHALNEGRNLHALEHDVIPAFLHDQRWYADKTAKTSRVHVKHWLPLEHDGDRFALAFVKAADSLYQLPLTIRWERYTSLGDRSGAALAAVRRGPREGTLLDATSEKAFAAMLLAKLHAGTVHDTGHGRLEFLPSDAFRKADTPNVPSVNAGNREQSNTTLAVEGAYIVKVLRRVTPGIHPEVEFGRFFEATGFTNAPAFLGSVDLVDDKGDRSALVIAHAFVENQGDAWTVTSAGLGRFSEEQRLLTGEKPHESAERAPLISRIAQIGRRTAEMHVALASRSDIPDFAPEPISADDAAGWIERLERQSSTALKMLSDRLSDLPEVPQRHARLLLERQDAVVNYIRKLGPNGLEAGKIRHHGDLHLGQILIAKDDAYILDFEGEPQRPLAERRAKAPAARDVAGLIRSIDYATATAIQNLRGASPDEHSAVSARLAALRGELTEALWRGYSEVAGVTEGLWPKATNDQQQLLEFFVLEKAFYELEYEAQNRPDWLHIPLDGVRRILLHSGVLSA
jgi:maltose alpha-D-glucosyltransferase/alpha-amylase